MATLNQIFILFLLIIIGYVSKRLKVITNDMNRDLSSLILNVSLPALVITSLSSFDFSREMMVKSGKLIMISWGVYALSIVLSYIIPKLIRVEGTTKDIFQFLVVFSNVGFMGYPVANAVFGAEGVFYAALYNLPFNVLLWTFGVAVLSRPGRMAKQGTVASRGGITLGQLVNPGIVSVFIGFVMFATSTKLPGPILTTFELVGNITTPLSMMFVGSILSDTEIKSIFTNSKVFIASGVRLILIPMMVLFILKLFPLDKVMIGIPVVIAAMPVAANCAILATRYGNDYHLASQIVFISTMLSMVTIPLIVMLL